MSSRASTSMLPTDSNVECQKRPPIREIARCCPESKYHFGIERTDGRTVRWTVDGAEMAKLSDPMPLMGPGHEYLGFNNWEVRACFDDLNIVPLPD